MAGPRVTKMIDHVDGATNRRGVADATRFRVGVTYVNAAIGTLPDGMI